MAKRRFGAGGKKAPERQGQPPRGRAEGGPRAQLAQALWLLSCLLGGNGKAVTVTSPPLGDRARRTTPQPQWGCPSKGIGGGGLGLEAGTLHAPGRARAVGRGDQGLSEPSAGAWHPGHGKGRKLPTSNTIHRLVGQCDPGLCARGRCLLRGQSVPRRSDSF